MLEDDTGAKCGCTAMHCLCKMPPVRISYPVPMKGGGRVHISLSRMVGMPVMYENRQVGCVESAMVDARGLRLDGVVIRKGIGAARWAGSAQIMQLCSRCVLLGSQPVRMPPRAQMHPGRVFLSSGACAGDVTDAFLSSRTLRISALEVCQGPLYRLVGQRAYAAQFQLQEDGNVVAQELLSWAQLVRQLGEEDDG